ncbi:hypothetical protein HK405_004548, partial [Cladochytrium tenue]
YAAIYRRLSSDYTAYLEPLSHKELLLKMMANMALCTAPDTGNFVSICLRLMRSVDDGGYADPGDLLADIEGAAQLDAQYVPPSQAKSKTAPKDSARSAINKRPPKPAKGASKNSKAKSWDGVGRITREIFGLPEDFDRMKARPGDYGTCTAHSRWEPHAASGCPSKTKPVGVHAKAARSSSDDLSGPRAKSARTAPPIMELPASGLEEASAILQFLRFGETSAHRDAPNPACASSARDSACTSGAHGPAHRTSAQDAPARRSAREETALRAWDSPEAPEVPPDCALLAGARGELEGFVLPPPARGDRFPVPKATTPSSLFALPSGDGVEVPKDFERKTPAKELKRVALKEYMAHRT